MANGEFSPQELRDFFQSYSNHTMTRPWNKSNKKSKRAAAREQQLFFTLENLPHRT